MGIRQDIQSRQDQLDEINATYGEEYNPDRDRIESELAEMRQEYGDSIRANLGAEKKFSDLVTENTPGRIPEGSILNEIPFGSMWSQVESTYDEGGYDQYYDAFWDLPKTLYEKTGDALLSASNSISSAASGVSNSIGNAAQSTAKGIADGVSSSISGAIDSAKKPLDDALKSLGLGAENAGYFSKVLIYGGVTLIGVLLISSLLRRR